MDELTKRNFNALSEGLKMLRADMSQLKIANKHKDEQIQQLRTEYKVTDQLSKDNKWLLQ